MKDLPGVRDVDIDRLLSGKVPEGDGFDDLAAFVRAVQANYVGPPERKAARSHIAAAAAAAREAAVAPGGAVAQPPLTAPAAESLLSRWRRRTVFGVSVATMTLSIGAAAIAATAATGGLAAKGDLPGPVQRVVAQAASGVGITLPSGDVTSGSSGHGSGSGKGGPSTTPGGSGSSHQTQAGDTPSVSPTSGRGSRDGSSQSAGVLPTSTPGDDRQSGRGRTDAANGVPGGAPATSAGHDSCVTYAERISGTLGLTDGQRSTFVSLIDHDSSAVTAPVAGSGKPDAACQSAINAARASAAAGTADGGGADHSGSPSGKSASPTPTPTPTVTPTHDSGSGSGGKGGGASPNPTPSPSDHGGHGGGN